MAKPDQGARNRWAKIHKEKKERRKQAKKRSAPPGSSPAVARREAELAPRNAPARIRAPGPSSERFRRDLERFLSPSRPVALSRFHDGEYHMVEEMPYKAASGWRLYGPSWLRDRLIAALEADLDDYWVGISPPCDWPQGTSLFRSMVKTKNVTFATVFWHRNFAPFMAAVRHGPLKDACLVTSGKGDYEVPAAGAVEPWDLDGLVTELLGETRTILVAAGPCACVIAHEYWKRADPKKRQTILDVGAAIDPLVHGRNTRDFHDPRSPLRHHECTFQHTVPWARPRKKSPKGWKGYLSRPKKDGPKE